jgi:hypothetical protein
MKEALDIFKRSILTKFFGVLFNIKNTKNNRMIKKIKF